PSPGRVARNPGGNHSAMGRLRTLLSWSSGKDSAWTLHALRNDERYEVVGLLTTINCVAERVAMHAVRTELLRTQAAAAKLPVWGRHTHELAREMIAGGLRARLTCIDPRAISAELAGREFDLQLLRDLPPTADPCGERGEFHTFAYDGPMFAAPVPVCSGEVV